MNHPKETLPAEALLAESRWLRRLAQRLVADQSSVDDVVQQTMLKALEGAPREEHSRKGWLAAVVRNVVRQDARSTSRRTARERQTATKGTTPSTDEIAQKLELQRQVAEAVLALAEPYRSTLLLRYVEGLRPVQIADRQGVSDSTVRVRLKRGLDRLREWMDHKHGGDRRRWVLALIGWAGPEFKAAAMASGSASLFMGATLVSAKTFGIAAAIALGMAVWMGGVYWSGASRSPDPEAEAGASPATVASVEPEAISSPARAPRRSRAATREVEEGPRRLDGSALPAIRGQVRDHEGRAVRAALIEAIDDAPRDPETSWLRPPDSQIRTAYSDETGAFELPVPAHLSFLLRVKHEEFAVGSARSCFAGEYHEIVLSPGTEIRLRVIAEGTREPLPDVDVGLRTREPQGVERWSCQGRTDGAGACVFRRVPPGELHAWSTADGHAAGLRAFMSQGVGALQLELALAPECAIEGTVRDASGSPVAGARVRCHEATGQTDAQGRYRLGGLGAGKLTVFPVIARAPGLAPDVIYTRLPEPATTQHVDFVLGPAVVVRGRVVNEAGDPVPAAHIPFRGKFSTISYTAEYVQGEARSGPDGRFTLDAIRGDGSYRMAVVRKGAGLTTRSFGPCQGTVHDLGDIVVGAAGGISGQVSAELDGALQVLLEAVGPESSSLPIAVHALGPGRTFEFRDLGAGRYRLRAFPGPEDWRTERALAQQTLSLRAGEWNREIVLRPAAIIRGFITEEKGAPVDRMRVALRPEGGDHPTGEMVSWTEDDGRFEFLTEEKGDRWLIVATDPVLRFQDVTLPLDAMTAGDVHLVVQPRRTPHQITGRVIDDEGNPVTEVYVQLTEAGSGVNLQRVGIPDERGYFEVKNLDYKAYHVQTLDFDDVFLPARIASVLPGSSSVELRVKRRAR